MEKTILAEVKSLNKLIECEISIDETTGHMTTQYPTVSMKHPKTGKYVSGIQLTKEETKTLLGIEIQTELANIPIRDQSAWRSIEGKVYNIRENYREQREKEDKESKLANWEKMLRNNEMFTLTVVWNLTTNKIQLKGLPSHLYNSSDFIARKLDHQRQDDVRDVSAKELDEIVYAPARAKEQARKDLIKKLHEKAIETGRPQVLESVSAEYKCYMDRGSEDRIVTYVNPDGSIVHREEKAEPDHY